MRRHRRSVLASVAAGAAALAGCSGADSGPRRDNFGVDDELPPSADGEGESNGADGNRRDEDDPLLADVPLGGASVVELETGDRTLALGPQRNRVHDGTRVELLFAETATADDPATVRARVTNDSEAEREVRLSDIGPFAPVAAAVHADESIPRRYFAPTPGHDLVTDPPAFERGPEGFWRLREAEPTWELPATLDLEPGESVDGVFAVVGSAGEAGFPPGTYDVPGDEFAVRLSAWRTSEPGISPDSEFVGTDLPPLPRAADTDVEPVWYHDVDPRSETYLEPETERAETPAELSFELVNHAHGPLTGQAWRLSKLVDDGWYHVGPERASFVIGFVRPGESREWTVRVRRDRPPDSTADRDDVTVVPYLGGGRYAFVAPFGRDGEVHAAAFDLEGEPVELEPTEDLEAERDGNAIRAVSSERGGRERPWRLTLERLAEDESADQRLIPEQVMRRQRRGVRNTLSLLTAAPDGVERVTLETSRLVARRVAGPGGERRRFRYGDRAYGLTATPLEEG